MLASKSTTAALTRTAGVTTGERAAMQVRSLQRAIAARETGARENGGTKLKLTALGGKQTSPIA
jgi:hypothetical protein